MDPFKNIRPYTDAEVAEVLQSLANNSSVLKAFIGLQFPGILSKVPFLKFFVKRNLTSQIKNIQTIDDYQMIFKDLMEKVVKESIASFKVNGLERLNQNDNRFESLGIDYHKIVYDGFVNLQKKYPKRIINVDAGLNKNLISKKIKADLKNENIKFESEDKLSTKILIEGDEKNLDLNKIITQLKKHKINIVEASIIKPSLDGIFRKITQRKYF